MTTDTTAAIRISPISTDRLQQIWAGGLDDNGESPVASVDELGGAPLRCCLRDSRRGERLALIGYRPASQPGPYAEIGPVFIHAEKCAGYRQAKVYPEDFRRRPQVFRAYRADGAIVGGVLVEPGTGQERAAERLLADPAVTVVHSRNVIYGCFMFEMTSTDVALPSA